jgi:hypothetical protein
VTSGNLRKGVYFCSKHVLHKVVVVDDDDDDDCEFCVPLDDPGERRRSLSTVVEEDTDMRMHLFDDANDININMIMQEADEQLKNGTISISHYNTVLKQVSIICYIMQKVLLIQTV